MNIFRSIIISAAISLFLISALTSHAQNKNKLSLILPGQTPSINQQQRLLPGSQYNFQPLEIVTREIDGTLFTYIPDRNAEEFFTPEQIENKFVLYYIFFMGFVGISAFVMIVIAGIQYTTSAGNPAGINAAKEKIWNALFGLALAAGSYIILRLINPDLVTFKLGMRHPAPIVLEHYS